MALCTHTASQQLGCFGGGKSATSGKAGGLSEVERLKAAPSVPTLVAQSLVPGAPNCRRSFPVDRSAPGQSVIRVGAPGQSPLAKFAPFRQTLGDLP